MVIQSADTQPVSRRAGRFVDRKKEVRPERPREAMPESREALYIKEFVAKLRQALDQCREVLSLVDQFESMVKKIEDRGALLTPSEINELRDAVKLMEQITRRFFSNETIREVVTQYPRFFSMKLRDQDDYDSYKQDYDAQQQSERILEKKRAQTEETKIRSESSAKQLIDEELQKVELLIRKQIGFLGMGKIFRSKNIAELHRIKEFLQEFCRRAVDAFQNPDLVLQFEKDIRTNVLLHQWRRKWKGKDLADVFKLLWQYKMKQESLKQLEYEVKRQKEPVQRRSSLFQEEFKSMQRELCWWREADGKDILSRLEKELSKQEQMLLFHQEAERIARDLYHEFDCDEESRQQKIQDIVESGEHYEWIAVKREAIERSFSNIRESIRLYLVYYFQKSGIQAAPEIIRRLREEVNRVRQDFFIEYREDPDDLLRITKGAGKIKTLKELIEEMAGDERRMLLQKAGAGSARELTDYHQRRAVIEQILFGSLKPVYAFMNSESAPTPPFGHVRPGEQYGPIRVLLDFEKIKNRSLFTENDSMSTASLTPSLRVATKKEAAHRQLIFEHALIAQAIYNLDARYAPQESFEKVFVSFLAPRIDVNQTRYVECHIVGGFSLEEVRKILVDSKRLSVDDRFKIDQVIKIMKKRYPQIEVIYESN